MDSQNLIFQVNERKIYLSMKQIDRAKLIANSVIQKDKNFVDGYLLLVSIYEYQKKYLDAERILDEALSFNPNHHELQINKVWILRELGNLPEALKVVSQMSIDNPNDWEAFSLLALLYNDLEDYRAAEDNAKKSMRINSDQPGIMMLLGQILKKQGQLDQAIEYFSKAAIATPAIIDPCIEIGDIYFEQQNFPDALDAYQEAINRKENDARPYYKAGLIMKEVKDYQGAEKMLKIAASFAPKDSTIRRQLAGVIALNFVHSPLEAK
jgi:tetratricopeptide (TPR) repeat protein